MTHHLRLDYVDELGAGWELSLDLGFWRGNFRFFCTFRLLAEFEPDPQHVLFLCLAHPWLVKWLKKDGYLFWWVEEWVEIAQQRQLHRIEDVQPYFNHDPFPF